MPEMQRKLDPFLQNRIHHCGDSCLMQVPFVGYIYIVRPKFNSTKFTYIAYILEKGIRISTLKAIYYVFMSTPHMHFIIPTFHCLRIGIK